MTPNERAEAYWKAHRMATDCSLRDWFKRCENDLLDRISHEMACDADGAFVLSFKHEVTN